MRFKPSPQVAWRRLGDEVVLVEIATGRVVSLNRTAARFWELLVQGMSVEEAQRTMLTEFEVTPEELELEASIALASLQDQGLLRPV